MELRQLRNFIVLAEELHFGRAAQRVNLTQPALSNSVARLEEDMKAQLFQRDSKGVALTAVGRGMLSRAKEIVSLTQKMERLCRSLAAGKAGFIEIGFSSTLLFRGLDQVLRRFRNNFPEIVLSLNEFSSEDWLPLLRSGRIDAAFIASPVPPVGFDSEVMAEEKFVACLPQGHFLASLKEIDVAELKNETFVMLQRTTSQTYFQHISAICTNGGFQPAIGASARLILTIVKMVGLGFGVSIVPESMIRSGIPGVSYVALRGVERAPNTYIAWDPQRDTPGLDRLIETVRISRESTSGVFLESGATGAV